MPRPALQAALLLTALTAPLVATPAWADLENDTARLRDAWMRRGASVERREPIFVDRAHDRMVAVPQLPGDASSAERGCLTVALLAPRTLEFSVALDLGLGAPSPLAEPPDPPEPGLFAPRSAPDPATRSAGGALMLSRCGAERAALKRVMVSLGSNRGAVEILIARSLIPLGEIRDVLPERAAGPIAPRGDPGGPIEPAPLRERLLRVERQAKNQGASRPVTALLRASNAGAGQVALELGEGCHRIHVMAEVPALVPRRATDVDAEARAQEGGRVLARDRADVPDARLEFCLGETTVVEVAFAGGAGPVNVALSRVEWPLPAHIPLRWGARARAGFATALRRRHAPDPVGPPIVETLGVSGVTQVPVEIDPGRCYLAALSLVRGEAKAIRFSAQIGGRSSHDALERPEGAAFSFCAETDRSALLEVDLRGGSPWWVLALWPVGAASP